MAQNWFKHDYNARNDDNILELRAEYGWKGYGLFYAFIETMAENEKGAIDINKIGGLSVGFSLPKEELIAFIETCIEIGLFTKDEDGFIRNNRITKHVEKLKGFKEAGKKGAKKRWSKDSDRGANRGASGKGNATPNADKIRKDKKKESAPAREEHLFEFGKEFDQLQEMEKPLTVEQREKLVNRFGEPMVEDVLISMENHQGLTDKYKSVYLTALNWCKKRQDDQPEKSNSNQGPKVRPDTVIVN